MDQLKRQCVYILKKLFEKVVAIRTDNDWVNQANINDDVSSVEAETLQCAQARQGCTCH